MFGAMAVGGHRRGFPLGEWAVQGIEQAKVQRLKARRLAT